MNNKLLSKKILKYSYKITYDTKLGFIETNTN